MVFSLKWMIWGNPVHLPMDSAWHPHWDGRIPHHVLKGICEKPKQPRNAVLTLLISEVCPEVKWSKHLNIYVKADTCHPWCIWTSMSVAIWQGPLAQAENRAPMCVLLLEEDWFCYWSGACSGWLPSHGVPLIFRRRSRQHVPWRL